jgi:hypothetical protein
VFLRWGLVNYLPKLAWNRKLSDLCLWVARIAGISPVSFLFLSCHCSSH